MSDDLVVPPSNQLPIEAAQLIGQAMEATRQLQLKVAAYCYREAAGVVAKAGATDAAFWSSYFLAESEFLESAEFGRNGNRAKSLEFTSQAINRLADEAIPAIDTLDVALREAMNVTLLVELNTFKMSRSLNEMMQDVFNEDYQTALDTARRILTALKQDQASLAAAQTPPETANEMQQIRNALASVGIVIDVLRAYAEASQAVSDRAWDTAMEKFAEAKTLMREAANAYSANPRISAQAQMWSTMIETMIDPARSRARQLRAVWANFDQMKEEMTKVARAVGAAEVNNNNFVAASADIKNKVDVNISIVNEFESHTREALTRLRDAIKKAPVTDTARDEILKKIDDVMATPSGETGFFDKFKKFTATSADIVGNIAKVAGPVATAWNLFGPFFGLPLIPVPPVLAGAAAKA